MFSIFYIYNLTCTKHRKRYKHSKLINTIKKIKRIKKHSRIKFILLKTTIFYFISYLNENNHDYDKNFNFFDGNSKEIFDSNFIFISRKINKRDRTDILRNKSISKLQIRNDKSFFKHLLLLSGDIEVNPGPVQFPPNTQNGILNTQDKNGLDKFEMFKKRGLHFIHVNINSVLPKIEEIRYIARSVNLSVIGLSESKLDNSVNDNEISIPGYDILRKDRNRHGGGVLAYIKNDLSYNIRQDLSSNNEALFF